MATDARPSITPNLVVGICITAVGVALVLDRLHVIEARQLLRFWPLAVIVFGASMVVQALQSGDDAATAGSGRRTHVFPRFFVLILVGILVTQTLHRGSAAIQTDTNERVNLFAVMSRDQRVSYATGFHGGEMTSFMGECQLDLRHATVAPGEEAVIDVFTLMGGLVLQVPDGWTIDVQALPVMGGVTDRRSPRDRDGAQAAQGSATSTVEEKTPPSNTLAPPRVVLRGFIMMGGLVIRS